MGVLPIRKISPNRVALTSYYSKLFVERSEKSVSNYPQWLCNQIMAMGIDSDNTTITDLKVSDVFDPALRLPRLYSTLGMRFKSFSLNGASWYFDYASRKEHFNKASSNDDLVARAEKNGMVMVGLATVRSSKNVYQPILVDKDNTLYQLIGDELKVLGTIEQVLGLDGSRVPLEQIDIRVFGKNIPVGFFLAYQLGMTGLFSLLKVTPRRVLQGERVNLNDDEYSIVFADETLVFQRENRLAMLYLSGFRMFANKMRDYSVHSFDKKDIYFNLLDSVGLNIRYLREMDLIVDMFVDPVTKEILVQMNEPVDVIGLLLKSGELLMTDWSPDEIDTAYMRFKGYERMAGAVYAELVKAVRTHQARRGNTGNVVEMPPYVVWNAVQQDPSIRLVEESNPIHNLKEKEEVTYSGTGGRSRRSMVKNTRKFHQNDMGVISEATKDSSDVAVTTFLTADPGLTDIRGLSRRWEGDNTPATLMSTSALLAPCADRDDPKRVNFISIQQSAGLSTVGYRPTPLRTGYEQIVAHRTDDLFATTASSNGEVTTVTPKSITVTYGDGSTKSVELGRRFGTAAGTIMPHTLETTHKVGDKIKKGDIVAYNSNYFELDPFNNKQVLWKGGVLVKTAILECADTLEDSSVISERVANELATPITKVREIVVKFDQVIRNLVEVGSKLDIETILCTIEDPVMAQAGLFDDESLKTLRLLSAFTPRAKYPGTVEKIEIFYHGDLEDMSDTLREKIVVSDKHRRSLAKQLNKTFTSGSVDGSMHINSQSLEIDHAVIRIYITKLGSAGVGDKGVFANQLKTIFGRVMSGVNETESGEPIDAIFGYQSISDRIVLSPELMGTTNTLLKVIGKRVVDVYNGKLSTKP